MAATHSSAMLKTGKHHQLTGNHAPLSMCCNATLTAPKAHATASRDRLASSEAATVRPPSKSRRGKLTSLADSPVILPPPLLLQPNSYIPPPTPSTLQHKQQGPRTGSHKRQRTQATDIQGQEGCQHAEDIIAVTVHFQAGNQHKDALSSLPGHLDDHVIKSDVTQPTIRKRTRRRIPTHPTQPTFQPDAQHMTQNANLHQQHQQQPLTQPEQTQTRFQAQFVTSKPQAMHQARTTDAILLPPPTLVITDDRAPHTELTPNIAGEDGEGWTQPLTIHELQGNQNIPSPKHVYESPPSPPLSSPPLLAPPPSNHYASNFSPQANMNMPPAQQMQQQQDWQLSDLEQAMQQAYQEADRAMAAADLVQATPIRRSLAYKLKGLTSDIQDVPDWQTLAALLQSDRDFDLNAVHVASAWTRLAHLHAYTHLQHRPSSSQTASNMRVDARINQLDGLDLMTVAGAAAAVSGREGQVPARFQSQQYLNLLQMLEGLVHELASTMTPREASTVLWAAASLGHTITIHTLTVLLQVMLDHYKEANSLDWTLALWGAAKALSVLNNSNNYSLKALAMHMEFSPLPLEHHEQQEVAQKPDTVQNVEKQLADLKSITAFEAFEGLRAAESRPALPNQDQDQEIVPDLEDTPQQLQLQQEQSKAEAQASDEDKQASTDSEWLREAKAVLRLTRLVANHVIVRLPSMPRRCLAICLHSLGSLRSGTVMVSHKLRSKVLTLVMDRASHMTPRDLVASLNSLANLDVKPPEDWMKKTVVQAGSTMRLMAIEEVTLFLHACALMHFRPAPLLLMAACSHTSQRLASCSTRHICILIWSMAKLRWKPPVEWFDAVMTELLERKHELGGQELALMCYSLAKLHYVPEPGDMQILLPIIHRVLQEGDELTVATICWALPRLTPDVGRACQAALLHITLDRLMSYSTHAMAKVLWCVARCSSRPPSLPWLQSCLQWYETKLDSMNPQEMTLCLWALAKLGYHHGSKLFTSHIMSRIWSRARPILPVMALDSLTALLHASAWVDYAPAEEYIQDYVDALSLHSASFSPSTLQGISSVIFDMRQKWNAIGRKWSKAVKEGKEDIAAGKQYEKFRRLGHAKGLSGEPWRPVGWVFQTPMQGFDDVGLRIVGN